MVPVTLTKGEGTYTRVNRNNPNERSVIDYILMTEKIAETSTDTIIDEEGNIRIMGKKESDHNTITTKVKTKWVKKVEKKENMECTEHRRLV